jgi:hypothetical protein
VVIQVDAAIMVMGALIGVITEVAVDSLRCFDQLKQMTASITITGKTVDFP